VTSGLLVFAKTPEVNRALSMQFEQRQIEKYYLALSVRKPKKKQGKVLGDMARGRRGSWKLLTSRENPAITQFFSSAAQPGQRLFLLKPTTGKTHQLRVALKSIGAPIAGDALYGGDDSQEPFDRTYLHAYALAFTLEGEKHQFVSVPTQGALFTNAECLASIEGFGQPWRLTWPS
jgi:tRNA pseudouridine32 synthase/23S rRNA pseudouridine746 synthase